MKTLQKRRMLLASFVIFLLISSIIPTASSAGTTYYVSAATGDNSHPGTHTEPFLTIEKALTVAGNQDTIEIMGGTYTPATDLIVTQDGIASQYFTIRNHDGGTVIINGTNVVKTAYYHAAIELQGSSYTRISGITIEHSAMGGISIRDTPSASSNVIIDNMTIQDCSSYALKVETGNSYITLENSTIRRNHNNWSADNDVGQEVISLSSTSHFTIQYNSILNNRAENIDMKSGTNTGSVYHNIINTTGLHVRKGDNDYWGGIGIYIDARAGICHNISIYNNLVYGNNTGIKINNEAGAGYYENIDIYNNIVNMTNTTHKKMTFEGRTPLIIDDNAAASGIKNIDVYCNTFKIEEHEDSAPIWIKSSVTQARSTNINIKNNILAKDNTTDHNYMMKIDGQASTATSVTLANNLYHNFGSGMAEIIKWSDNHWEEDTTAKWGTNPQFGDPLFVYPNNKLQLEAGSPAIEAGTASLYPPTDYFGTTRIQNQNVDIGSYEAVYEEGGGGGGTGGGHGEWPITKLYEYNHANFYEREDIGLCHVRGNIWLHAFDDFGMLAVQVLTINSEGWISDGYANYADWHATTPIKMVALDDHYVIMWFGTNALTNAMKQMLVYVKDNGDPTIVNSWSIAGTTIGCRVGDVIRLSNNTYAVAYTSPLGRIATYQLQGNNSPLRKDVLSYSTYVNATGLVWVDRDDTDWNYLIWWRAETSTNRIVCQRVTVGAYNEGMVFGANVSYQDETITRLLYTGAGCWIGNEYDANSNIIGQRYAIVAAIKPVAPHNHGFVFLSLHLSLTNTLTLVSTSLQYSPVNYDINIQGMLYDGYLNAKLFYSPKNTYATYALWGVNVTLDSAGNFPSGNWLAENCWVPEDAYTAPHQDYYYQGAVHKIGATGKWIVAYIGSHIHDTVGDMYHHAGEMHFVTYDGFSHTFEHQGEYQTGIEEDAENGSGGDGPSPPTPQPYKLYFDFKDSQSGLSMTSVRPPGQDPQLHTFIRLRVYIDSANGGYEELNYDNDAMVYTPPDYMGGEYVFLPGDTATYMIRGYAEDEEPSGKIQGSIMSWYEAEGTLILTPNHLYTISMTRHIAQDNESENETYGPQYIEFYKYDVTGYYQVGDYPVFNCHVEGATIYPTYNAVKVKIYCGDNLVGSVVLVMQNASSILERQTIQSFKFTRTGTYHLESYKYNYSTQTEGLLFYFSHYMVVAGSQTGQDLPDGENGFDDFKPIIGLSVCLLLGMIAFFVSHSGLGFGCGFVGSIMIFSIPGQLYTFFPPVTLFIFGLVAILVFMTIVLRR